MTKWLPVSSHLWSYQESTLTLATYLAQVDDFFWPSKGSNEIQAEVDQENIPLHAAGIDFILQAHGIDRVS